MSDLIKLVSMHFKKQFGPTLVCIISPLFKRIHPRIYNMKIIPQSKQININLKNIIIIKVWKNFVSKEGLPDIQALLFSNLPFLQFQLLIIYKLKCQKYKSYRPSIHHKAIPICHKLFYLFLNFLCF